MKSVNNFFIITDQVLKEEKYLCMKIYSYPKQKKMMGPHAFETGKLTFGVLVLLINRQARQ